MLLVMLKLSAAKQFIVRYDNVVFGITNCDCCICEN